MYECSQRLKREIHGIESLKRQKKCLLACLNLLKLVDKKLSWLAVAGTTASSLEETATESRSRFNFLNSLTSSNSFGNPIDLNINVDIADYDEINRNYMLVDYMIRLSKIMSNQSSIGKNKFIA